MSDWPFSPKQTTESRTAHGAMRSPYIVFQLVSGFLDFSLERSSESARSWRRGKRDTKNPEVRNVLPARHGREGKKRKIGKIQRVRRGRERLLHNH